MCRVWIPAVLVLCFPSYLFAQVGSPDFSGVYLRSSSTISSGLRPGKGITQQQIDSGQEVMKTMDEGSPLILSVTQTTEGIKVTEIQNGAKSANLYLFRGGKTDKSHTVGVQGASRARINKDTLILKFTMEEVGPFGGAIKESVEERWNLSPDSSTLKIRSTRNGTQTFTRQASLESAMARAAQVSLTNRCVCLRLPPGSPRPAEYKEGADLGFTVYRQLNRCVIFDAGIYGDFFKGLQRKDTPNGPIFGKSGQRIATFPDDLSLEISFRAGFSYGPLDPAGMVDAPLPAELSGLRFQIKWTGSSTRDLGELPAELLSEPSPEQLRPKNFYRIELPAKGVPLDDTLEVRVLTRTGAQIGCIRGNI